MKIRIPTLTGTFSVSHSAPEIYLPNEIDEKLLRLRGTRVWFDYEREVDGPQTSTRLLKNKFQEKGLQIEESAKDARLGIWTQSASERLKFVFVVVDLSNLQKYLCSECGPRELTAAIMTATCKLLLSTNDKTTSQTTSDLLKKLDSDNEQTAFNAQEHLVQMGDVAVRAILDSMTSVNRKLSNAALSRSSEFNPPSLMRQLGRRVKVLGLIRSPMGVKAVLDALGDSAMVNPGDPFYCAESRFLKKTSEEALIHIGQVALPLLKKFRKDDEIPFPMREAFRYVISRIPQKRWWQFGK